MWSYGDIDQGDEAIYSNGVLFVNGAGEDTYQSNPDVAWDEAPRKPAVGDNNQTGNRIANSRHATMSGQVYVATNDAMIYAFGTPMGR